MVLRANFIKYRGNKMHYNNVRFGIFTDLHLDIMHDGRARLNAFIDQMEKENVDFIIQLGDFCYPEDTSKCLCSEENLPVNLKNAMTTPIDVPKIELLEKFNHFSKPHYHVLGNHELDFCSKKQAMKLYGMENRFYSFTCKGWKFIVLDGNNFKTESGEFKDYYYGDYFDSKDLPYIDPEQMSWLEKELFSNEMPVVIFSHQPLNKSSRGIKNADELLDLFDNVNKNGKRVYLCINGHTHVDVYTECNGVGYYTLNSMSNHWIGKNFAKHRFSNEIESSFPNLQYTFPYKKPLYAVVELDSKRAYIKGKTGEFFEPGPVDMGCKQELSASIRDREIVW